MLVDKHTTESIAELLQSRADVSRRSLLHGAALAAGGAVAFAAAMATTRAEADTKMTQAAAGYQTSPKNGQRCDSCALYQPPASCKLVDGNISPAGWCKFYAKKSAS